MVASQQGSLVADLVDNQVPGQTQTELRVVGATELFAP